MNPITSPTTFSIPRGPCRAGVAVIVARVEPRSTTTLCHGFSPYALLRSRRAPAVVYGVVEGYRRAAEVLAERMLNDRYSIDLLIFPFAMCWRHTSNCASSS
jgi:hypothetical protein